MICFNYFLLICEKRQTIIKTVDQGRPYGIVGYVTRGMPVSHWRAPGLSLACTSDLLTANVPEGSSDGPSTWDLVSPVGNLAAALPPDCPGPASAVVVISGVNQTMVHSLSLPLF